MLPKPIRVSASLDELAVFIRQKIQRVLGVIHVVHFFGQSREQKRFLE